MAGPRLGRRRRRNPDRGGRRSRGGDDSRDGRHRRLGCRGDASRSRRCCPPCPGERRGWDRRRNGSDRGRSLRQLMSRSDGGHRCQRLRTCAAGLGWGRPCGNTWGSRRGCGRHPGGATAATECAGFMRNALTIPSIADTLNTAATIRPPAARWRVFRRLGPDGAFETDRVLAAVSTGAGSSDIPSIVAASNGSTGQETIVSAPDTPGASGVGRGTGAEGVRAAADGGPPTFADRPLRAASAASRAARSSSFTVMSPASPQLILQ